MDFKSIWNKLFSYTPSVEYNFSLPETSNSEEFNTEENNGEQEKFVKIFPSINVNKEYMQTNICKLNTTL